jgi:hypothetical protein
MGGSIYGEGAECSTTKPTVVQEINCDQSKEIKEIGLYINRITSSLNQLNQSKNKSTAAQRLALLLEEITLRLKHNVPSKNP